ncbi:hypothetical protein BLNAU_13287 [Blattamonas nauphoetae]|uniref:Uncharacterized protein n=1 Tax=Blattamonas nauphoetae TaxID=2049346 RepID=A0ABQ9XJY5_9EUKA|nr:hypothetical protein BLNAU_13287 [Blattamonas nauphoetae]
MKNPSPNSANGTENAPCTLDDPCSLLSTAVSLAPVDGSVEVQVGTGLFGSATLSGTQKLTLNGLFAETDCQMNHPATSFSVEMQDEIVLTLKKITLFPLEGLPLVDTRPDASGVSVSMDRIHLTGSGITAVPLDFQAGEVTLQYSCFESLSDIQCSLISVAGTATLTISECMFMDIDIKASVIHVNGGGLKCSSPSHFRRITRTEGEGSAAIDARNPQSLRITATICHCHSVEGVAGALYVDSSGVTFDGYLEVLLIGNRGKDDETAHDIFFTGVTQDDLSKCSFSSCSDRPRIISENTITISPLQLYGSIWVIEDEVMAYLENKGHHISPRSIESTDFTDLMSDGSLYIVFQPSAPCVLTFSPLTVKGKFLSIKNLQHSVRPVLAQSNKTDETLFKLTSNNGQGANLEVDVVRIPLNTQHTAPMITVDAQSKVRLFRCVVSSDGGLSRRPFVRSEGHLDFYQVLFIDMSFDGCSCIETTGGKVEFSGDSTMETKGVYSLSTNVNGAFLNAINTNLNCSYLAWVDCHARNGGVIFTKDCIPVDVSGFFIDCSAEERGGGFCSEHSNSISQSTNFKSASSFVNCHAKFGGGFFLEIAPMMNVIIQEHYQLSFFRQTISTWFFEGCSAEKEAGAYLDGEFGPSAQPYIDTLRTVNDAAPCEGSHFFISQSLADSIIENGRLVSDFLKINYGSLSSRSESEDGPYKHVEVEGYPEYSYNFELPNILVDYSPTLVLSQCIGKYFTSGCNSLSHLVDRFHTQTDNGRFLQVPLIIQNKLFLFETARVTKQSIKLIHKEGYTPP